MVRIQVGESDGRVAAPKRREARFRLLLSYVVTVAWGISFILDAALTSFQFSPYVHGLMMVVAAYYFYLGKDNDDKA